MRECTADSLSPNRIYSACMLCFTLPFGIFASGCSQDEHGGDQKNVESAAPSVTKEDASKIRNALEAALEENNHKRFVGLFSKTDMFNLVFDDVKLSTASRRKIESNISRGGNIAAFASQVLSGVQNSGKYRFVRQMSCERGTSLLFRFVSSYSAEIAYHRYDLIRGYKSKVRICNVYFYLEEDSLVSRIRQKVLSELHSADLLLSESGKDLSKEIVVDYRTSDEFNKFLELGSKEKWQKAWTAYQALSEPVRQSRSAALQRLVIAEHLGDFYVKPAIDDARKRFPTNIRTEYFAFEYYQKRSAHEKVIEAIDRIISIVDDPYLKLLKLNAMIQTGKLDDARETIKEFEQGEIDPVRLLVHRFELSVAESDFSSSVQILDELKKKYRAQIENLSKIPRYTDLLKSSEYREWKTGSE